MEPVAIGIVGGVVGLGGSALGRAWGVADKLLAYAQERARWQHELRLIILAQQSQLAETENPEWIAADAARSERLDARDAPRIGDAGWVSALRSITRPLLALLLWVAVLALALYYRSDHTIASTLVDAITYSATSSAAWWYGDRGRRGTQ